jgi:hypothetical protein
MLFSKSSRRPTDSFPTGGGRRISVLHGAASILSLQTALVDLSERCGQPGAMDHLEYFLRRPKFASKIPCLILFSARRDDKLPTTSPEIAGAVLLYQYQFAGVGLKIFVADYHAGDRTVVAPAGLRAQMASLACAGLLERGALVAQLTYHTESSENDIHCSVGDRGSSWWRWASTVRVMHGHIPLAETYDGTLAGLGKHTRRNLRESRRRAERELNYTFVTDPVMSREEYLAFNRRSSYAVSEELAAWRYEAMKLIPEAVFLGLRSGSGEWMSLIGGRRSQDRTFVEWQMNRNDMAQYSLRTLMRSHLLEHEVKRGSKRLYLVGGTSHSIKLSQGTDYFVDLVALRFPLPGFVLRLVSRTRMLEQAFLVRALTDPKLKWKRWDGLRFANSTNC